MSSDHVRTLLATARQELSGASTLDRVMELVRHFARVVTAADGATFVLKEGSNCFYADEDAIGPLWKGRRFPQTTCISGWVMMSGRPVVIEDVFVDPRIPVDVYRSTFVKSLAMVPIGGADPVAAIGNYWAQQHRATPEQVSSLQTLADYVSSAMAKVR